MPLFSSAWPWRSRALVVEAGDGGNEARPGLSSVQMSHTARISETCGIRADEIRIEPPKPRKGRIGEPHAAVGAEHHDAFRQIVERLALHPNRGLVAAFEVDPLGQILEHPGDAALAAADCR